MLLGLVPWSFEQILEAIRLSTVLPARLTGSIQLTPLPPDSSYQPLRRRDAAEYRACFVSNFALGAHWHCPDRVCHSTARHTISPKPLKGIMSAEHVLPYLFCPFLLRN